LEIYFQHLSSGISRASKFLKISVDKPNKQIYGRLTTAGQGGQKNHNGETTAVLFRNVFY
jgi:hypothetical protein